MVLDCKPSPFYIVLTGSGGPHWELRNREIVYDIHDEDRKRLVTFCKSLLQVDLLQLYCLPAGKLPFWKMAVDATNIVVMQYPFTSFKTLPLFHSTAPRVFGKAIVIYL